MILYYFNIYYQKGHLLLTHIVKNTFSNLNKNGLKATPLEYKKAFCEEAKKMGYVHYCYDDIHTLDEVLSPQNTNKLKELNITSMEELLTHIEKSFENFMSNEDLCGLINIVRDTLSPSLGNSINDEIDLFNKNVANNPQQLFDSKVQTKIHELFEVRCNMDKKMMSSKTKQLTKMLTSVAQEFTNTMKITNQSNTQVLKIRKNIEKIDTNAIDDNDIENIKEQMISVTKVFETETNRFSSSLEKNSTTINNMTKRIEQLEKNLKDAKEDSITDFMTGLMTRRGFDEYILKIEKNFSNKKEEYSAVFFDIDHFKKVNDTYGHDAGDTILTTFAKLLQIEIGKDGEVFRFGGEEFVSIFPKKDVLQSLTIAEKIRKRVESSNFIHEDLKLKITFSAGVAQRSIHENVESLISNADALLYKAKQNGRNQVVV